MPSGHVAQIALNCVFGYLPSLIDGYHDQCPLTPDYTFSNRVPSGFFSFLYHFLLLELFENSSLWLSRPIASLWLSFNSTRTFTEKLVPRQYRKFGVLVFSMCSQRMMFRSLGYRARNEYIAQDDSCSTVSTSYRTMFANQHMVDEQITVPYIQIMADPQNRIARCSTTHRLYSVFLRGRRRN